MAEHAEMNIQGDAPRSNPETACDVTALSQRTTTVFHTAGRQLAIIDSLNNRWPFHYLACILHF
jgi:hypothetical protein